MGLWSRSIRRRPAHRALTTVSGVATMFRKHANFGDYSRSVLISVAAMLLGSLSFGSGRAVADGPLRSDRVDTAIVFAVDRSSLSHSETLQMVRDGHIAALRSLNSVMTSGPNQCVAVTYREWSGEQRAEVVLPWSQICSKTDADAAARTIALYDYGASENTAARKTSSFSLSIEAALADLDAVSWGSNRKIVNLSVGGEGAVALVRPGGAMTNVIAVQNDRSAGPPPHQALMGGEVIATTASSSDYIAAIERTLMLEVGGDRAFFMRSEERYIKTARTEGRP